MDAVETQELFTRALGIVARCETILAPTAFAELGAVLEPRTRFANLAITRSERPGFFRVLASTRGQSDGALPFRRLLSSARHVYEAVYKRGEPYLAVDLERGTSGNRAAGGPGFGSYVILPIREAPSKPVVAGLVVTFEEPSGIEKLPMDLFADLAASIGTSVSRGLSASQRDRALRILESSGDALIAWDAEGRITDVNRATEHLTSASRSDLLGLPVQELFGTIPTGLTRSQRLSLQARDGRRMTVAATVSVVRSDPVVVAHALIRDLSDVVAAEQEAAERLAQLRELTEQHLVLLDNAPLLIFRLDPESHEILDLTRHAEHLFGVPAARALSTPGFLRDAHVDPEGATAFEEAVVVAKLGQALPAYEAHLRRESADPIIARGTIYPILTDAGRVVSIEGILLDVTGERGVRSRLLQADRLATVGILAAGVAHEINNPAAFMLLGLEVLSRTLTGPTIQMAPEVATHVQQLVADLCDTGKRIVDIARDMRTFASPAPSGPRRRTLVDVRRTIESALTITRAQIVEKADIEVDLAADLPLVSMDDGRLGQVVVNLLVNAAQAVAAARAARDASCRGDKVRIYTSVAEGDVLIVVEDTGVGIKKDTLDRVFVPFFTTKPADVGMGLGLAISRTIVEGAGGTISVESPGSLGDPPCGSRFTIRLPAFLPDGAVESVRPDPASERRGSVLLVEDEQLLGRALCDKLSEAHNVVLVNGGEDALSALARHSFDAILCDIKMPGMGGEELYRAVLAAHPEQANSFIFMTGVGFAPELERFLSDSGAPLLEKPFPIDLALRLIAERVDRRQIARETFTSPTTS